MKGRIVRIRLKQFMVFTDIDVRPGENLNLLLAPNGCGKSSLLAGIILGLGGKPNDIGRASHLGDFVKSGCKEASTEIELLNPEKNYIIQRNIVYGSNKSTWFINGDKVTHKQVEELMSKLHIQVDNLCQVLPQDRVCEFSRMNPQTLLENTEKSVGPEILTIYHNQLKEMSKIIINHKNKLKDKALRLEKEEAINHGLKEKVEMMLRKTEFIKKIALYKQQRAWVIYNEQHTFVQTLKASLLEAQKILLEHKKKEEQVTAGMNMLSKNVKKLTEETGYKNKAKLQLESSLRDAINHADKRKEDLERIDSDLIGKKREEDIRLESLRNERQHLSKLENDLALHNVPEEETKEKVNEITEQIVNLDQFARIGPEEVELQQRIERIKYEIQENSKKKKEMEDKTNVRLRVLSHYLPDVHQAILWLRDNHTKFKAKIYEPMVLEIDVKDDSYIKYVEHTIPARDLQAFTCEDVDDMNQFLHYMRKERKLRINAVYSGPEHKPSSSYTPTVPAENLMNFGFTRYVKDMFTAPETIMKYLCRTARIHLIPVGSSVIDDRSVSLPNCFTSFYSDTKKYTVRISRYGTNEKSVILHEIKATKFLSSGVDKSELNQICAKIGNLSLEKESLDLQLPALVKKRHEFESQVRELKNEKTKLIESIQRKYVTKRKIQQKKMAIRMLESEGIDVEEKTREANSQKNIVISSLCEIDERIQTLTKELDEGIKEFAGTSSKLCGVREQMKTRENDARRATNALAEQTDKVMKLEEQYRRVHGETKHYHQEALKFSNGKRPDESFFNSITENRDTLSRKIQELKAKADFMNEENKNIIVEFENRKKLIKEISGEVHQLNGKICEVYKNVLEIRDKWLPDLQEFIEKINHNFGRYFMKLGCAGEVTLHSDDPDNYDLYGIYIKVKFRDGDKLQDLNHYTQSGGERSVATALYMISMQELTCVPFRCVDEINQGMDPINERRVFQLLVDVTEDEEDTSQYFLLTPKLLPGLTYNKKTKTIVIMTGSVQNNMVWWNVKEQIKTRRNLTSKKK